MSETASQLLATFESLPAHEQHEVFAQILRHSRELPEHSMTDEELIDVADSLFQSLDAEETNGDDSGAG